MSVDMQRGASVGADVRAPSPVAAGVAAAMPLVVGVTAAVGFAVPLGVTGMGALARDTGWPLYAVLAVAGLGALALSALLWGAGRGARVPAAASLALAGLPWVAGLAGEARGVSQLAAALGMAEPTSRGALLAQGLAEAGGAAVVGAWCSSALAGALALGLAIGALGQRAAGRVPRAGLVGAGLALPLVGLVAYALASGGFGRYTTWLVVATVRAVFAFGLAAAAVGVSTRGRATALAAAVGPATLVSFLGALFAAEHGAVRAALHAAGDPEPDARLEAVLQAASAIALGGRVGLVATLVLGGAAVALAGWAVVQERPGRGALAGGGALVLVAALGAAFGSTVEAHHARTLRPYTAPAWGALAGFDPAAIRACDASAHATMDALVAVDRVLPQGEAAIAAASLATPEGRDALTDALRARLTQPTPGPQPEPADDVPPPPQGRRGAMCARVPSPQDRPGLTLAVDGRVEAPLLRAVLEAAAAAGAQSIDLVGTQRTLDPEARAQLRADAPLLVAVAEPPGAVRVLLERAVDGRVPEGDTMLWHALVGAEGTPMLLPRPGATDAPRPLDGTPVPAIARVDATRPGEPRPRMHRPLAWLVVTDGATAQQLASSARSAATQDFDPIVVIGALPAPPRAGAQQMRSLGRIVDSGTATAPVRPDPQPAPSGGRVVASGTATAAPGALMGDALALTFRARLPAIQQCYERELQRDPTLQGRVVLRFAVRPDGSTEDVAAAVSTFPDERVGTCLVALVRTLRFPAGEREGPVAVSFPFVFAPP